MTVFVIAELNNKTLAESTYRTVTCANHLSQPITLLLVGYQCEMAANEAANIEGVTQVILVDASDYQHPLAENLAEVILHVASKATYLFMAATTFGKNLMPRVAALFDVAQISDITAVKSEDTFVRPIYAGNALATVQSFDPVKVITVRSSMFPIAGKKTIASPIEKIQLSIASSQSEFIKLEQTPRERPELTTARVIVAGGRGLQNGENFKLIEALADRLGAAIGASRAAVDAGFVPNDYQVGQTGKVVAPDLYIAIGISGAIQHIAGMKDSKVIVAINKDPEAPIFNVADYGIVGDLFEVVPQLTLALGNAAISSDS